MLKPSEIAPLDAVIFAEIMHEAGTPPGVFNMIFGEGRVVGARLSSHPDVDMVSITGSTRAGVEVAISAAPTVKRVAQELGGKSPLLILDDADLQAAVTSGVAQCMVNSGQTCVAPTRMLVPRERYDEAVAIAAAVANGDRRRRPGGPGHENGPDLEPRAIREGAAHDPASASRKARGVMAGGPGRPEGLERGFYARPTVFADVRNDMTIAREEIFGPVLVLIPYDGEEHAIAIANDTEYGLAGYIATQRPGTRAPRGRAPARGIGAHQRRDAGHQVPFGGYKTSGNGREYGAKGWPSFSSASR